MNVCAIRHPRTRSAARGDTGRQRWMVREVDPNDYWAPTTSWQFTDYDGEQPYVDYDVEFDFEADPATADAYETLRYLDGSTVHAQQAATNGSVRYYHGDLTGSTNALTDTGGTMQSGGTTTAGGPFYYTSFGERCYYDTGASSWKIGGEFPVGSPRYMYDGGHGYENGFLALAGANSSLPAITLQHVGERWYEPDIGRFVQRDPIGLGGGVNVYAYVANCATNFIDPSGFLFLAPWWDSTRTWSEALLDYTGGRGYVPVADPGIAQDITRTVLAAPAGVVIICTAPPAAGPALMGGATAWGTTRTLSRGTIGTGTCLDPVLDGLSTGVCIGAPFAPKRVPVSGEIPGLDRNVPRY